MGSIINTNGHRNSCHDFVRFQDCALFKDAAIRFRTVETNQASLPEQNFEWMSSVYGNDTELIPRNIPEALGKPVSSRISYMPTCSAT